MSTKSKGKRKAATPPADVDTAAGPSESSPLLPPITLPAPARRTFAWSTVLIALGSTLLAAVLFIGLLAASYRPSESELASIQDTVHYSLESVHVPALTNDSITVNVTIRAGVDADAALGTQRLEGEARTQALEHGWRGVGAVWWESLRRRVGRVVIRKVGAVNVRIAEPVHIFDSHFGTVPLIRVDFLEPFDVPLVSGAPSSVDKGKADDAWLRPVVVQVAVRPVASIGELWAFTRRAWAQGEARVVVGIEKVEAGVLGYKTEVTDLSKRLSLAVPALPNLPHPGRPLSLNSLLTLDAYHLSTSNSALSIIANASVPNFIPRDLIAPPHQDRRLRLGLPFQLPFSVSLANSTTPIAHVLTAPVTLRPESEHIALSVAGTIDSSISSHSDLLSTFLQNYLHGLPNPVVIRGSAAARFPFPGPVPPYVVPPPPAWLLASLPSLAVPLEFPAHVPKPQVVKSVTIDNMRIGEKAGKMTASGTVVVVVELPDEMAGVDVDVGAVLPNVLVFDGPAPDDAGSDPGAGLEPGEPDGPGEPAYPPRAFGRIRPDAYLSSTTSRSTDPAHPRALVVRAPLVDQELLVLSGRDAVLSDFVSKVVFKGGAQAGILGTADVKAGMGGIAGTVDIRRLPVRGEFWVGRQRAWLGSGA
ncbi:hypothetical protein Q5752_004475 [Cryptotrichosporon argae]